MPERKGLEGPKRAEQTECIKTFSTHRLPNLACADNSAEQLSQKCSADQLGQKCGCSGASTLLAAANSGAANLHIEPFFAYSRLNIIPTLAYAALYSQTALGICSSYADAKRLLATDKKSAMLALSASSLTRALIAC